MKELEQQNKERNLCNYIPWKERNYQKKCVKQEKCKRRIQFFSIKVEDYEGGVGVKAHCLPRGLGLQVECLPWGSF